MVAAGLSSVSSRGTVGRIFLGNERGIDPLPVNTGCGRASGEEWRCSLLVELREKLTKYGDGWFTFAGRNL